MKKKNKLLKWLSVLVVLLIVLAVVGRKAGWFGGKPKKMATVEKVRKRTIVETVSASGKIQPEIEVKISPDVSGEIVELPVKEGDRVKKGDLLARILPDIYQSYVDRASATVNSSRANLKSARSRLEQAQSQYEKSNQSFLRNQKLFEEKLISPSEWEAIKSANEVAKAEVDAAVQAVSAAEFNIRSSEASLKEAQDNLRKTTIYAPVDGTISKLNVEKGERVVGTSQMAGTEMMRLADLNEMEVSVSVNENDIVRVHMGDTASIEVDAYLGKKFKGIVTEVANSANISGVSVDQVTNFTVKVRIMRESYQELIDNDHLNRSVFNPGMSATVDIRTKYAYDVLSVPIQSVTTRDTTVKSGRDKAESDDEANSEITIKESESQTSIDESSEIEVVFVNENGKVKMVPVQTGIQDNMFIEIKKGLSESIQVVSAPYSLIAKQLSDGDEIEVTTKEKLYSK